MKSKILFSRAYVLDKWIDVFLLDLLRFGSFELLKNYSNVKNLYNKPIEDIAHDEIVKTEINCGFYQELINLCRENSMSLYQNDKIVQLLSMKTIDIEALNKRKEQLESNLTELQINLQEIGKFKDIAFNLEVVNTFSYSYYTTTVISDLHFNMFIAEISDDIWFELKNENMLHYLLIISSKKQKWKIQSIVSKYQAKTFDIPLKDNYSKIYHEIVDAKNKAVNELNSINGTIKSIVQPQNKEDIFLWKYLKVMYVLEGVKASLHKTNRVYVVEGFIPEEKKVQLHEILQKSLRDDYVLDYSIAENMDEVKSGTIIIPTYKKVKKIITSFSLLIKEFSIPQYYEVDPTIIFIFVFTLFFGIMFGDVGHGLILLGASFLIKFKKVKILPQPYWIIVLFASMSSIFFGFLFGSFFGKEDIIQPLWIRPIESVYVLFGFVGAIGVLYISLSLIFNFINSIREKDFKNLIFSNAGLISGLFYWGAITFLIKFFVFSKSKSVNIIDFIVMIVVPGFFLLMRQFLEALFFKNESHQGGFFEALMEFVDVVISYVTNTVSFIRVGAFALAHFGLSYAVSALSDILRKSPIGKIINIFWLIAGTMLIIFLEGLIVYIQILRLNYYEFFSRFYRGGGREFKPFKI